MTTFYEELVLRNAKGEELTDDEMKALTSNLPKWRAALVALLRNVDSQITTRKSMCSSDSDFKNFESWKASSLYFKKHVLDKLSEVNLMIRDNDSIPGNKGMMLDELREIRALLGDVVILLKERL